MSDAQTAAQRCVRFVRFSISSETKNKKNRTIYFILKSSSDVDVDGQKIFRDKRATFLCSISLIIIEQKTKTRKTKSNMRNLYEFMMHNYLITFSIGESFLLLSLNCRRRCFADRPAQSAATSRTFRWNRFAFRTYQMKYIDLKRNEIQMNRRRRRKRNIQALIIKYDCLNFQLNFNFYLSLAACCSFSFWFFSFLLKSTADRMSERRKRNKSWRWQRSE